MVCVCVWAYVTVYAHIIVCIVFDQIYDLDCSNTEVVCR